MDHTTNHQLSQWENTDRVLMEDFNADNAKIDAALRAEADARAAETQARAAADAELSAQMSKLGNCQISRFTYTGTGPDVPQVLTFPKKPLMVMMMNGSGCAAFCLYGFTSSRLLDSSDGHFPVSWTENSLTWTSSTMNAKGTPYPALVLYAMD